MKAHRGFTFVGFLFLLAGAGAIYGIVAFGPAYWDNVQLKSTLHEAANLCMRQPVDDVHRFIDTKLAQQFDTGAMDERGNTILSIDYDTNQDVRIERTEQPRFVNIWVTYQRHVPLPLIGGERILTFNQHVEQDLSPVKW
jgi:Flp pilus assembly protein TadG